jgi:hypothetical protein
MNGEIGAKIEKNEFIVEMSFPIVKDGMDEYNRRESAI